MGHVIGDKALAALISRMSLAEKAALVMGRDGWNIPALPRLGVPGLLMSDGPHGVRLERRSAPGPAPGQKGGAAGRRGKKSEKAGPNMPATCFPSASALACSFSPRLCAEVGGAMAKEALYYGVGLVLGPGVNIKRGPLCGRNFEYFSEDPLLAGEMGAGLIEGLQAGGAGACLKHLALNNQESWRMNINAAADTRALFDIYLRPFEIAVQKGRPATVMASYNRVCGLYATENRRLLTDILRLRFGFKGLVMSDWGAVNNRPAGIAAGCDLEMPASGPANTKALVRAVQSGALSANALDTACWNILRLVFACGADSVKKKAPAKPGWQAHHRLCADALAQSAVLLKNEPPEAAGNLPAASAPAGGVSETASDILAAAGNVSGEAASMPALNAAAGSPASRGILPLRAAGGRVAVIGGMAEHPRIMGGGSSVINPTAVSDFLSAMKAAGHSFVYARGYTAAGGLGGPKLLAAAEAAAAAAETVLLFLGLPDACECEGYDRENMDLPQGHLRLLQAVAAVNPNIVVLLCCGSPVSTPWLCDVKALLCLHLGGQATGEAAVRLIYGLDNPGGKLAETWPLKTADTPCYHHFPEGPNEVRYAESIFVGYRYYDTAQKPVRFPFGFGLSYTRFAYSGLTLSSGRLAKGEALCAAFTLSNTGGTAGDEIVQAYLRRKGSAAFQPMQELAAFQRVRLNAGESKTVTLNIPYEQLAFYDDASGLRLVEAGEYELHVGGGSRCLPLCAGFAAGGVTLRPSAAHSAAGPYGNISDNTFALADFAPLYGKPFEGNTPPRKGAYTPTTPLGLMNGSAAGRGLLALAHLIARRVLHFSPDAASRKKSALANARGLPFKNVAMNSRGLLGPRAAQALLDACNGKEGLARMLVLMLRRE